MINFQPKREFVLAYLMKNVRYFLSFVFLIPAFFLYVHYFHPSAQKSVEQFQKTFSKKTKALAEILPEFKQKLIAGRINSAIWDNRKIDFRTATPIFVYDKGHLIFWTDNHIPIPRKMKLGKQANRSVIRLKNGWYYQERIHFDSLTIVGLFLVKSAFPYQNESLKNTFPPDLSLLFNAEISLEKSPGDFEIHDHQGKFLFSLLPTSGNQASTSIQLVIFILLLLGICSLSYAILSLLAIKVKNPLWTILIAAFGVFVLRLFAFNYEWFGLFSTFEIFQPQLYASSFLFPTLGDLSIAMSLFATICLFGLKNGIQFQFQRKSLQLLVGFSSLAVFFIGTYFLSFILRSLVEDSSIPLYIHALLDLNSYSYLVLFSLAALFVASFIVARFLLRTFLINLKDENSTWTIFLICASIYFVNTLFFTHSLWVAAIFPPLFGITILWMEIKKKGRYSFGWSLIIISFFVGFTNVNFYSYLSHKEHVSREVYAKKIISEKDPTTEIEYAQISSSIAHSDYLQNVILKNHNYRVSILNNQLEKNFFKRYWERYEMSFYLYDADSVALVNFATSSEGNFAYFESIIQQHCDSSDINKSIFFVKDYVDKLSYLIRQPIYSNDSLCGYLICTLRSKIIPKEIGFPRLLLNDKAKVLYQLEDYSIGKYINQKLVFRYGDFNYSLKTKSLYNELGRNNGFVDYKGYNHYIYKDRYNRVIVLSLPEISISDYLTSFSFLFAFFGLCVVICLLLFQPQSIRFKEINLAFKIQLILIGLVLFTLLFFSWGTGSFVSSQYNNYNTGLVREKINSVNSELQQKVGFEGELRSADVSNYLEYTLQHLSTVFATDINIYNLRGKLVSSSRSKIYNIGLISNLMHPWAFRMLRYQNKSEVIHEEKIGKLSYLSAYIPIVNEKDTVVAYLNLQYFARQNQFDKELASFLTAIINVFVFLLAFTVIITVFVTNWITAPLKLIQKGVASMKLGAENKPIKYNRNDEIGSLVKEYNLKLEELENNALELAKSEREYAWREMAKQVAHEIKNPLTPMKLSIQHLQRSLDPKDPDAQEKMNKIANSIVEQIDALTKIANEFSNFAKLPKPKEEALDIVPVLSNVINVFNKEINNGIYLYKSINSCVVIADKDLMIRVFNNLIKNAIQAIPEDRIPKIDIQISELENNFLITIADNGSGISDEMKSKIFVPNFTTKSTGTGLGLAMVKQIVETHQGRIWFETHQNIGTTFYIELPKNVKLNHL